MNFPPTYSTLQSPTQPSAASLATSSSANSALTPPPTLPQSSLIQPGFISQRGQNSNDGSSSTGLISELALGGFALGAVGFIGTAAVKNSSAKKTSSTSGDSPNIGPRNNSSRGSSARVAGALANPTRPGSTQSRPEQSLNGQHSHQIQTSPSAKPSADVVEDKPLMREAKSPSTLWQPPFQTSQPPRQNIPGGDLPRGDDADPIVHAGAVETGRESSGNDDEVSAPAQPPDGVHKVDKPSPRAVSGSAPGATTDPKTGNQHKKRKKNHSLDEANYPPTKRMKRDEKNPEISQATEEDEPLQDNDDEYVYELGPLDALPQEMREPLKEYLLRTHGEVNDGDQAGPFTIRLGSAGLQMLRTPTPLGESHSTDPSEDGTADGSGEESFVRTSWQEARSLLDADDEMSDSESESGSSSGSELSIKSSKSSRPTSAAGDSERSTPTSSKKNDEVEPSVPSSRQEVSSVRQRDSEGPSFIDNEENNEPDHEWSDIDYTQDNSVTLPPTLKQASTYSLHSRNSFPADTESAYEDPTASSHLEPKGKTKASGWIRSDREMAEDASAGAMQTVRSGESTYPERQGPPSRGNRDRKASMQEPKKRIGKRIVDSLKTLVPESFRPLNRSMASSSTQPNQQHLSKREKKENDAHYRGTPKLTIVLARMEDERIRL